MGFCEKGILFLVWLGGFVRYMTERVLSYKNCLIPPLLISDLFLVSTSNTEHKSMHEFVLSLRSADPTYVCFAQEQHQGRNDNDTIQVRFTPEAPIV